MSNHIHHDGYSDDKGEMESIGEPIADFLPPPSAFSLRLPAEHIAIPLRPDAMAFFTQVAVERHLSLPQVISDALDQYAAEHAAATHIHLS